MPTISTRRSLFICGMIPVIFGAMGMFGWIVQWPFLTSFGEGYASMKFHTGLGFALSGVCLILYGLDWRRGWRRVVALTAPLVVLFLGLVTLVQYFFGINFGLDQWPVADLWTDSTVAPPGRMSVATAAGFVLIGVAQLLMVGHRGTKATVVQGLALLASFFGLLGFMGYFLSPEDLQSFYPFATMALSTALLFLVHGVGVLFARPTEGYVGVVMSDHFGGVMARRIIPLVIAFPVLLAWLRFQGQGMGLYKLGVGVGAITAANIAILITVIWLAARTLNRLHDDLLEVNAQLRGTLREINDFKIALDEHAIVAVTNPKGRITYVNDKFCAISKFRRDELIGQDHRIINSGHHSKEFFQNLWETIRSGHVWHGEIKNRAKDGSIYWVDTTIVPFLGEDGKPVKYMAVRADITPIKRTQEELARSNEDLGQFAYVASHDLQEPLRAVSGCLQILKMHLGDALDERASELMAHSVDGSHRMQKMIEGLLEFSRIGANGRKFGNVDLSKALERALLNLETAISSNEANITFDKLPTVQGDEIQLSMVFQNLLSNSLKFRRKESPKIHIAVGATDEEWILSIQDNGIGIAPEFAERIFTLFQRLHTRREYPGTGIGLAVCRKIVEHHRGRIWVESEPDNGTTFFIGLPKS